MKWIKYQIVCNEDENVLLNKKLEYTTANLAIAQNEAYNGEYAIVEDEVSFGTKPLSIEFGGTGATNASSALTKLGALAASKRGAANGVAPLNSSKKIDSSYLPSMNYVSASQVGVINGIASLDSSGKVPSTQLPSMNYIPTSQKGAASGVAPLNASKKIDSTYLPSMNYIPTSEKGAVNGVASLGSSGKLPSSQLPSVVTSAGTLSTDQGTISGSVKYYNLYGICFVYIDAKLNKTSTTNTVHIFLEGLPTPYLPSICVSSGVSVDAAFNNGEQTYLGEVFMMNDKICVKLCKPDRSSLSTGDHKLSIKFVYHAG